MATVCYLVYKFNKKYSTRFLDAFLHSEFDNLHAIKHLSRLLPFKYILQLRTIGGFRFNKKYIYVLVYQYNTKPMENPI